MLRLKMRIVLLGLLYLYSGSAATLKYLANEDFGTLRSSLEGQCEAAPYRSVFKAVSKGFDNTITCYIKMENCEKLLSPTWLRVNRELTIGESRLLRSRGIDDYSDNVCLFEMQIQTAIPVCKYGWTLSQRSNGPWQCYKTELTMPKTYEEAREICAKQGAKLPQTTSKEDYDALIESWVSKSPGRNITDRTIFMGLAERSSAANGDFVWDMDGSTLGSSANQFPQFVADANNGYAKRCAVLRGNYDNTRIQQWFCDCVNQDCKDVQFKIRAVACQMEAQLELQLFCGKGYTITKIGGGKVLCTKGSLTVNATTTPQYFCEDNWYISNRPNGTPVCIKTEKANTTTSIYTTTYDISRAVCKSQNSFLPQLITKEDYDVLWKSWRAVMTGYLTSVYLGLKNYAPSYARTANDHELDSTGYIVENDRLGCQCDQIFFKSSRRQAANFIWEFDGTRFEDRHPNTPAMQTNFYWPWGLKNYERCVQIVSHYNVIADYTCDCVNEDCPDISEYYCGVIACMKVANTNSN